MKQLSKFNKVSALLGASLLMVTACAPDSLTRGGGAQPAPIERSNDNSAASNANEADVPTTSGVQAASGVKSNGQPASTSAAPSAVNPAMVSPLPTPTAEPRDEIEFTGVVEVIASDMWVVGGRTLVVTAATEIESGLTIGVQAKVHAVSQADGSLWAREIESAAGDNDNGNGNSNDNDNGNGNSNDDNGNNNDNHNGNVNSNDDDDDDNNGNVNSNDDNGNDDNGNGNVNSNDDNGNDDNGNGNVNSNDDNGNDDNGNVNSNDDNGNHNSNDDTGNDDHGSNSNSNDDHGGNDNSNGNNR